MNCNCKDKKHNCGEFSGEETVEEKLNHLESCRKSFLQRIAEIDKAIDALKQ